MPVEEGNWEEFILKKKVIKLRHRDKFENYEIPQIVNILDGIDYVPSVSRKYPLREKIDLWTSGNQAFQVEASYVIEVMLKGIIDKKTVDDIFIEISQIFDIDIKRIKKECATSYHKLIEIIERENKIK